MPHLLRLGHTGVGLEPSAKAWQVAVESVSRYEGLRVVRSPEELGGERFDYLLALEVLEHIEDDHGALRTWRSWIKPGGRILVTVPAHMRSWSRADEFGGHFRRYERPELLKLFEDQRFVVDACWTYGFPLTSITSRVRKLLYRHKRIEGEMMERTMASSFDSVRKIGVGATVLAPLFEAAVRPFHWLQLPFRGTELGDGYVVCAHPR